MAPKTICWHRFFGLPHLAWFRSVHTAHVTMMIFSSLSWSHFASIAPYHTISMKELKWSLGPAGKSFETAHTSWIKAQSQNRCAEDSTSNWHASHLPSYSTFRVKRFSLVGRISLHARQANCLTLCGILSPQSHFQNFLNWHPLDTDPCPPWLPSP